MLAAHNGILISDVVNDVVGNSRSIISCAFSMFACSRSVVGVATTLRAGRSVARIPVWPRDLSVLQKRPSQLYDPTYSPIQFDTGQSGRGVKLTIHL